MSDLLPNLNDLLAELSGSTPADRDARALAQVATEASTVAELDRALTSVVTDWRQS